MMMSQQQTSPTSSAHSSDSSPSRSLTFIEENAVRYTAGYVVRKLERKYSHQNTQETTECVMALKEMAGKIKSRDASMSHQKSTEWTRLTDCGGPYHVEDIVYNLFVAIECLEDKELPAIFKAKGKGLEKVKKEKLSWLCNDEDVQYMVHDQPCYH